jgi:hypothetical protein
VHAFGAPNGRAAEHLCIHLAALRLRCWEVLGAVQYAAGRFDPVIDEHRLHLRDHRAFGLVVTVAPVGCVVRIAGPLVAHSYATCKADAAVDDQKLAVRAIVQASKVIPGQLVIELYVASRTAGGRQESFVDAARAEPVEQDVNLHAALGGRGQRFAELGADRVAKHECFKRDARRCAANGVQHWWEDPVAIDKRGDPIACD